jgi:hypothetical protein
MARAPTPSAAPSARTKRWCCGSVAELRSVIVKARRLARDDAERERAAAAVKTWLLAQIEKKRAAPASDMVEAASNEQFAPERLAA